MEETTFEELRERGALPTLSPVGRRLLEVTSIDSYSKDDLVDVVLSDLVLAARVLHFVNDDDRERGDWVKTLPLAARSLGRSTLRSVVLALDAFSSTRLAFAAATGAEAHWSRCVAVAVAARALAREKRLYDPAEAFACGLLCDLGRAGLLESDLVDYAAVAASLEDENDAELALHEQSAVGFRTVDISAAMLGEWGFPRIFREATLQHVLSPEETVVDTGGTWALAGLLRASKRIASFLTTDPLDRDRRRERFFALTDIGEDLALGRDALFRACERIGDEWVAWCELSALPFQTPQPFLKLAEELERREEERDEALLNSGVVHGSITVEAPLLEEGHSLPGQVGTRVLIIDDDERMLRLLRHHLTKHGFEVFKAQSSEEGLNLALELQPQILVTDWMMPGMSGVRLCELLNSNDAGRKMYKLMVTARENDEQVVEAFQAGADDYIVKPFNPSILLARVQAGQRMVRMREKVEESERVRQKQVSELGILTRRLRAAALTDALTELPNRRYAMNRLKQEWENSVRSGRNLSVMMVDIDHFKQVNDQHGHDVGDAVLRETAHVLRSRTRQGDFLCRLGGEEFLAINVNCDLDQARVCGERLRRAVEEHIVGYQDFRRAVTVSIGIAQRVRDMGSIDDLLRRADEALYEAKDAGRNCCVTFDREDPDSGSRSRTA